MNAIDHYPDLPSPTNRDSAASAIFNLYGYSNRDSSQAGDKGGMPPSQASNGFGYGTEEGVSGEAEDRLVEELQSPRIPAPQRTTKTSPAVALSEDRTSENNASGSHSESHPSTSSRPKSMAFAPSLPVFSQAQESTARRHSSAVSAVPLNDDVSRMSGTSNYGLAGHTLMEEVQSAYLTVPSEKPQRLVEEEEEAFLIGRQPGEEEDAYHVRSTCRSPQVTPGNELKDSFQMLDSRYKVFMETDGTKESSGREDAPSRTIVGPVR